MNINGITKRFLLHFNLPLIIPQTSVQVRLITVSKKFVLYNNVPLEGTFQKEKYNYIIGNLKIHIK